MSGTPLSLGISLAVGRLTLDQVALVRIQDPQPTEKEIDWPGRQPKAGRGLRVLSGSPWPIETNIGGVLLGRKAMTQDKMVSLRCDHCDGYSLIEIVSGTPSNLKLAFVLGDHKVQYESPEGSKVQLRVIQGSITLKGS